MKKAKKLLCALLAMLFVLSGCGLSANTNVPPPPKPVEVLM